jgi:enamine deaminase RidA (YjgF/YER057c/UK114 family)
VSENRSWVQPLGWPRPKGYSNGVVVDGGRMVVLAGQVGWDEREQIVPGGFLPQFEQALVNVVTLLRAAGGGPEHLVHLRLYLTDKAAYTSRLREVGEVYRRVVGKHFPCMTAVVVAGLIEDGAMVEIEGLAALPAV